MELASTGSTNAPKYYSMDMSKDFIPMSVFSESAQGMWLFHLEKLIYGILPLCDCYFLSIFLFKS